MTLLWKLLRSHLSVAQTVRFRPRRGRGHDHRAHLGAGLPRCHAGFRCPRFVHAGRLPGAFETGRRAPASIGLGSSDFTPGELEELKGQPFVRDVGAFTPANYRVKGTVGIGSVQLSTYLFFEAVPDRFLDVASGKWKYEPGDGDIPIIIPRNYLNLYNYGFAKSQGLPQISEGIFQRVSLGHRGCRQRAHGTVPGPYRRVVEPSQYDPRPGVFIRWSNGRLGQGGEKQASRVIVETDRPVDAAISAYPRRQGL